VIPTRINGIDIAKDVFVRPNTLDIHYDADVWGPVDPQVFYPPRMSPEIKRHPMAFLGFGQGPRNCIGMKFAMVEMKLALVKLLHKYEIHPSPETPDKIVFTEGAVRTPKYGIPIKLKKRVFQ
jgi:cytochrome P450